MLSNRVSRVCSFIQQSIHYTISELWLASIMTFLPLMLTSMPLPAYIYHNFPVNTRIERVQVVQGSLNFASSLVPP